MDALTRGGPQGLPRPIELHAHDPLRYVGDMLAWVHQAIAAEREFLESPITLAFPTPSTPTPATEHEFAYDCAGNASFCSIDEDPSAFLDAPHLPRPHEIDFTPDARGVILPGHALFLDFPGVTLHPPQEGDVDQPARPFVDEDNAFIRELPNPELLAPPATTFGGEVLSGEDYIVVPEGYIIGEAENLDGENVNV